MKILIATDGSDYSTAAIAEACRVVIRPETADVLIVSAYEDAYPITAEPLAISTELTIRNSTKLSARWRKALSTPAKKWSAANFRRQVFR